MNHLTDGGKLILVFGFQSEEEALEAHHKLESLPSEFGVSVH
jgi:hypothetical protein